MRPELQDDLFRSTHHCALLQLHDVISLLVKYRLLNNTVTFILHIYIPGDLLSQYRCIRQKLVIIAYLGTNDKVNHNKEYPVKDICMKMKYAQDKVFKKKMTTYIIQQKILYNYRKFSWHQFEDFSLIKGKIN